MSEKALQEKPATDELLATLGRVAGGVAGVDEKYRCQPYYHVDSIQGADCPFFIEVRRWLSRPEEFEEGSYDPQLCYRLRFTPISYADGSYRGAELFDGLKAAGYEVVAEDPDTPETDYLLKLRLPLDETAIDFDKILQGLQDFLRQKMGVSEEASAQALFGSQEQLQEAMAIVKQSMAIQYVCETLTQDPFLNRLEVLVNSVEGIAIETGGNEDMERATRLSQENWKPIIAQAIQEGIKLHYRAGEPDTLVTPEQTLVKWEDRLTAAARDVRDALQATLVGTHKFRSAEDVLQFIQNGARVTKPKGIVYEIEATTFPQYSQAGNSIIYSQLGKGNRWITGSSIWIQFDARDIKNNTVFVTGDSGSDSFILEHTTPTSDVSSQILTLPHAVLLAAVRGSIGGFDIVEGQTMGAIDCSKLEHGYTLKIGSEAFRKEIILLWDRFIPLIKQKQITVRVIGLDIERPELTLEEAYGFFAGGSTKE